MFMRRGRNASSKRRALAILPVWLASSAWLWIWWISNYSSANIALYIPLTAALFYEYAFVQGALLYFMLKAKTPINRKTLARQKVAVITPCVPAQESLDVIEKQLIAMSAITYPHDSWILDEGGSKQVKLMARKHGVHYFTRKNISHYNTDSYPLKAKTKAGNINAWLHKVRSRNYDFFVQLDVDHLPKPDYLDKTLGYFRDKKVAWVQAPSVYNNLGFWTARGSAEQELGFHGPLQMGFYGSTGTPVIVGSHTTFRMSAILEINGFQPTRAEDHLNSLALIDKGWKGVFIPEVIAEGDGPETLNAYLSQQYAWAFSMFQILKIYSWRYIKNMPARQKFQYLFLQTWYPLWALSCLILFSIPLLGLLFNTYAITAGGSEFIYNFMPVILAMILVYWAGRPLHQPQKVNLSWRGIILHAIRWPVIIMAVFSAAAGRVKPYQITPKGKFLRGVPTIKLYRPFLFMSIVSASAILFASTFYSTGLASGLYVFAVVNMVIMLSVCLLDLDLRIRQFRIKRKTFTRYWLKPTMAVFCVMLVSSMATISAVRTNEDNLYALVSAAVIEEKPADLSNTPPRLLNQQELLAELSSGKYPVNNTAVPSVGMHSPLVAPTGISPYIRHTFVDWREEHRLAHELLTTVRGGNTPLITVEPKGEADGNKLLANIAAGAHDREIDTVLDVIGHTDNTVYFRFGHEMDLADLYPWGNRDSKLFIEAYRHVVDRANSRQIDNIKWVWGPAGAPGAAAYYPGDDVVDVIGTTVLQDDYFPGSHNPSFESLVSGRLWLKGFNKPVWITEFGAGKSNQEYQKHLAREAASTFRNYGFAALIYINIPDSNIAGPNYKFDNVNELAVLLGMTDRQPAIVDVAAKKPPAPKTNINMPSHKSDILIRSPYKAF